MKKKALPRQLTGDNVCRPMGWDVALKSMGAHPDLIVNIERLLTMGFYGSTVGEAIVRLLEEAVHAALGRHFPPIQVIGKPTTRGVLDL